MTECSRLVVFMVFISNDDSSDSSVKVIKGNKMRRKYMDNHVRISHSVLSDCECEIRNTSDPNLAFWERLGLDWIQTRTLAKLKMVELLCCAGSTKSCWGNGKSTSTDIWNKYYFKLKIHFGHYWEKKIVQFVHQTGWALWQPYTHSLSQPTDL